MREMYDDESLRLEVRRRVSEVGTITAWARACGLLDEQVGAFLRGARSAEPKLLTVLGLKKVVRYIPCDHRPKAPDSKSIVQKGDNSMTTVEKRLARKRLLTLMKYPDDWFVVDRNLIEHRKLGVFIKRYIVNAPYGSSVSGWSLGEIGSDAGQVDIKNPQDDPDGAFNTAFDQVADIEKNRFKPVLARIGIREKDLREEASR